MSPTDIFANDIVDIVKPDGIVHRGQKAIILDPSVSLIELISVDVPLDEGDILVRHLPHQRTESFLVDDPGYFAGFMTFKPSYKAQVHKIRN